MLDPMSYWVVKLFAFVRDELLRCGHSCCLVYPLLELTYCCLACRRLWMIVEAGNCGCVGNSKISAPCWIR